MKLISILILLSCFSLQAQTVVDPIPSYVSIFKEERRKLGEVYYEKATEFYKDGFYTACIDKINEFLYLFPKHPAVLRSLKLLSLSYYRNDQMEESIKTDLYIYREFPTIEDGLSSYFDAGKKMLAMGKLKEGKRILEVVKSQPFSTKVAKDAEIELKQYSILEEEASWKQ